MRIYLALIALVCLCNSGHAQVTPRDVPEVAKHEIERRGGHVERTGTIRSGLMAAALSPPADDSEKWFLTLVVKPGEPGSERMRQTLARDPALKAWVDVTDPQRSTMHYQVRSVDDRTQADWLSGLRLAIAKHGLPLVVLQPPKSGQFGATATIVKMIHGVTTGEDLSRRLREGIVQYVQMIELVETAGGGHPTSDVASVPANEIGIGVPPPFEVRPRPEVVPVAPPRLEPVDWPPIAPPVAPTVPPSPPVPTTPAMSLGWLTGALIFAAGVLTKLGHGWMATKLAAVAEFVREMKEIKNRPGPPNPNP